MILGLFDWIIIGAYFIVIFVIGFHFRHRETSDEYFLAGRSVGWFAVGASIFAANISSEHFIGLAGSGAASGLPVATYELQGIFCLLFFGWIFLPYYLKSKVFTMPEYLERRFSPGCRWFLTIISIIAYIFTKISVSLFAGAILIKAVAGWPMLTSVLLLVIGTGIYTIAGGLSAVIYTDMVQAFILIGGSAILTLMGMEKIGGFDGLRAALPPDFFHMMKPADDMVYPWTGTIFGIFILGTWYWAADQFIVQRTLSAKNLSHARGGTLFTAVLKFFPMFIMVLPGLIAHVLWRDEVILNPDMAYPLIVTRLMPEGLAGLMIAALLAALMSSLSAVFNSCSTLITIDIYKKIKPESSEKHLVYIGRWVTTLIVAISIVWIPMIRFLSDQIFMYLQSVSAYIGAPIAAVFFIGIVWKGATAKAAIVTLAAGSILGMIRFLTDILSKFGYSDFGLFNIFTGYAFLNFAIFIFIFCAILMIILSLMTEKPPIGSLKDLTFSRDSMAAGVEPVWRWVHILLSVLIFFAAASLWAYFS